MILKHKDSMDAGMARLERLLAHSSITKSQREDLEEALWAMRAGAKGEKEAAYHIDFAWKDGKNSIILHDLRIEHDGRVAQIDHLIINRALHCHVIESKGFSNEVKILDSGEWETKTRSGWRGMPSPIEQNRRHIEVLKAFIKSTDLAPKRLGISLPLSFHNWVLVSPSCHLRRKGGEWDQVVKMDMFEKRMNQWIDASGLLDTLASISRFVSRETLNTFGQSLVEAHKPASFDFAARFGISFPDDDLRFAPPKVLSNEKPSAKRAHTRPVCDQCGSELEQMVIAFCRFNSKRFGGKKLCRACQK